MSGLRVAVLVNGAPGSAMDVRARGLFEPLGERWCHRLFHRSAHKVRSISELAQEAMRWGAELLYVLDAGYSGVLAAECVRWIRGRPWVLDTGDAILALARSTGMRGPLGVAMTGVLERFALARAERIVVRGTRHAELLAKGGLHADVIQDGVSVAEFQGADGAEFRRAWGLGDTLCVGVMGNSVWSPKLGLCYGWELIELLALLPGREVQGVMVGGGTGIERLRARARDLGVLDRVRFLGHVPYSSLPACLAAMDVCLSTQTNDVVGAVRTTGKLPLYLASGRYILASDVGEASLVLPAEMRVPYEGTVDAGYPVRLKERVLALLEDRARLELGRTGCAVAERRFDYRVLSEKLERVLVEVVSRGASGNPGGARVRGRR